MRNFARAHSCAKSARAKSVRANPCALRSGDFTGRAARKATKAPSRREFTSRVEGARRTSQRQARRPRARPSAGGPSSVPPHARCQPTGSFTETHREATLSLTCGTRWLHCRLRPPGTRKARILHFGSIRQQPRQNRYAQALPGDEGSRRGFAEGRFRSISWT